MKKTWWWVSVLILVAAAVFIRFFRLTQSPPSPYWEEVALGYDAYSIALTGKDHHGNSWPAIAFESFGDWKPSGYFYALVPFIKVFGLGVWSVRALSALAGVGIVVGMGVLAWQLTKTIFQDTQRKTFVSLVMLLTSFSPWLIQFSRGGWEANLALFFVLWGVIAGLKSSAIPVTHKKRFGWLLLTILLLFASMYTYHSARVLAPALGLALAWQFVARDRRARRKHIWLMGYIFPLFLVAFLLRPFTAAVGTPALGQRVAETSILSDISLIEKSNERQLILGDSIFSRLMYHRYLFFAGRIGEQFLAHFNLDFLFLSGDANPRHSTGYFGLLYPFELVFLLVGSAWVIQNLSKKNVMILATWLFFGILPSALTMSVPHALRILLAAPVFLFISAVGAWQSVLWAQKMAETYLSVLKNTAWVWLAGLVCLYIVSFAGFSRYFLNVYPQRTAGEWQYGYEAMIQAVTRLQEQYPDVPVYIAREYGRPAMYYWFYTHTNPVRVQEADATSAQDQGEYLEFDNIHFVDSVNTVSLPAIVAASPTRLEALLNHDKSLENFSLVVTPSGTPVWEVALIP